MCFFITLIVLPEMIINSAGHEHADLGGISIQSLSMGNLGDAATTNNTILVPGCSYAPGSTIYGADSCHLKRSTVAWLYGMLDFSASIIFFLGYLWLRHYEKIEIQHYKALANFASVSDYSIFVKTMPKDLQVTHIDNKKVKEDEERIEAFIVEFWEAQIRAEVKKVYGDDDLATLRENHITDDTNNIVADVIICLDQEANIAFYQKQAPLLR